MNITEAAFLVVSGMILTLTFAIGFIITDAPLLDSLLIMGLGLMITGAGCLMMKREWHRLDN